MSRCRFASPTSCITRGWKIAFDTARPELAVETGVGKRNRLVDLAARSFVVLSHER